MNLTIWLMRLTLSPALKVCSWKYIWQNFFPHRSQWYKRSKLKYCAHWAAKQGQNCPNKISDLVSMGWVGLCVQNQSKKRVTQYIGSLQQGRAGSYQGSDGFSEPDIQRCISTFNEQNPGSWATRRRIVDISSWVSTSCLYFSIFKETFTSISEWWP